VIILALLVLAQAAPALPPNHPQVANPSGKAPSADELLKKLDATPGLKDQDKPFEVAASLGQLYAGQGRFAEARGFYGQAVAKAEPVRALRVAQRRALAGRSVPAAAQVGCAFGPAAPLDVLATRAQDKAKAGDAPGAVACATAALTALPAVEVQYGNTLFVLRDAPGSLAAYTRSLETFAGNTDARYARAALLLDTRGDDVPTLRAVKADLERVLKEAPAGARAPQARRLLERATLAAQQGGLSKLPPVAMAEPPPPPREPGQPPQLSPEVVQAFQNAPRTPEMAQNFVKLIDEAEDHLAHGRYAEARGSYIQVMPYQPDNPRLRAGMAWTMIRLNRQPMADNVWRAASENPEAISALGDVLKAKGDEAGARALWQRLKDTVPSFAPRLEGKL
jgi:tetratricopeptide (TPR) repeat protein